MRTVSRRGLFVIGGTGAAGAVLAACGEETDRRAEGRDPELLAAALAAETALGRAYEAGGGGAEAAALESFASASAERATELERLADAGPEAGEAGGGDAIAAGSQAIAAYREASGVLSSAELRGTAVAFLAAVAAEQAALRDLAGEDPAPRAFVTGAEDVPYTASEDGEETTAEQSEPGGAETTEEDAGG